MIEFIRDDKINLFQVVMRYFYEINFERFPHTEKKVSNARWNGTEDVRLVRSARSHSTF